MLRSKIFLYLLLCTSVNLFAQKNFQMVLEHYRQKQQFNGVVLVGDKGKIEHLAAVGMASMQHKVPINTQTKFKIASLTKTFTAVLILQLYQSGKIDLKATIGQYLPEYTGQARDKTTIHHMLTYSAGIPNCEGDGGLAVYQTPSTVDAFIKQHCSADLAFEPGTKFNYENGSYIILGKIIERITGKSFAKNLEENILKPLGMKNTGMRYHKNVVPGLALTYNLDDSTRVFHNDDPMYIENYFSAGAMYSTAADLFRFDQGIFTNRLFNKSTLELMLRPYPELYGVAYGFWVTDYSFGKKTFKAANRQGSIWGANANWLHLMEPNKSFIILSNTNASDLSKLTEALVEISTK